MSLWKRSLYNHEEVEWSHRWISYVCSLLLWQEVHFYTKIYSLSLRHFERSQIETSSPLICECDALFRQQNYELQHASFIAPNHLNVFIDANQSSTFIDNLLSSFVISRQMFFVFQFFVVEWICTATCFAPWNNASQQLLASATRKLMERVCFRGVRGLRGFTEDPQRSRCWERLNVLQCEGSFVLCPWSRWRAQGQWDLQTHSASCVGISQEKPQTSTTLPFGYKHLFSRRRDVCP